MSGSNVARSIALLAACADEGIPPGSGWRGGFPGELRGGHFRVNFVAAIDEVIEADVYDTMLRPRWEGAGAVEARELEEGRLAIAIFDASGDELVWRGIAEGAVEPGVEERERNRKLREAVSGILERFPPRRD